MNLTPRSYSLSRALLLSMVAVALVPVILVVAQQSWVSWDSRWAEVREKQYVVATSLVAPISTFITSQQESLALLASNLQSLQSRGLSTRQLQQKLNSSMQYLQGLNHVALLSLDGRIRLQTNSKMTHHPVLNLEPTFVDVLKSGHWRISGIKTSPFSGKAAVLIGQPVLSPEGGTSGVLLAELSLERIREFLQQPGLNNTARVLLIDQHAQVILNQEQEWALRKMDLSSWPVVSQVLSGKSGTATFYYDNISENVIAGFAPVGIAGWGVLVFQRESHINSKVFGLVSPNILWALFALLLAAGIALSMACWITRPINALVDISHQLLATDLQSDFRFKALSAPREIRSLGLIFETLVNRLQRSREEVQVLNKGLQERVHRATEELRKSNSQLKKQARRDYLTALPNRRFFETNFQHLFHRRRDDERDVCLMLIDVDHFKEINDQYGHAAGDRVLSVIASTLDNIMRPGDIVARYGGDEFVVQMRCSHDVGFQRARQIREAIESCVVDWEGETLNATVSVGVYYGNVGKSINLADMLKKADAAMYEAKRGGRNNIVEIRESSAA